MLKLVIFFFADTMFILQTNTMVYYTGYTESELLPLVLQFNKMIMAQPKSKLSTIRKKYSHR